MVHNGANLVQLHHCPKHTKAEKKPFFPCSFCRFITIGNKVEFCRKQKKL